MFEEEAEEKKPPYACCTLDTNCELWKDGFQKGAEFGYNKAKVEVEDSYRESLCNLELNLASVTEQLEELEKANEWNYVKGGIFPKDEKDILCQINFETYEVGYYHQEKRCFYTIDGREIDVIAWKEIIQRS